MKKKLAMMWSGGKDSSLALYKLLQSEEFEVVRLVSTFSAETERLSMHGIPQDIVDQQAKSIGLPLTKMFIDQSTHSAYEEAMLKLLNELKLEDINDVAFGDIFLEDLRKYREENLAKLNVTAHFPLWKQVTTQLINEFIELGFKTICCCTDSSKLDNRFLGQIIDKEWIRKLPSNVDVCGENGEFHTICIDGPFFDMPLVLDIKGIVVKEYFHNNTVFKYEFANLLLKD